MTQSKLSKSEIRSVQQAGMFVISEKKTAYTLETLERNFSSYSFSYTQDFLHQIVIEIHKNCGEMYYWEKCGRTYYLIKASTYSEWKDKKDIITDTTPASKKVVSQKSKTTSSEHTSKKHHYYHHYRSAYKEWLSEQGLCPKYGCVGFGY